MNAPTNLPTLIEALPSDATRAPQTEFVRALQVLFIENLSLTGSVRSAAAAAGVSHQTAYRARRSNAHFRLAWDGALVAARANAADTLACRAIDGTEEQVFYHGEVVATRRRYSDRLLLAHMARLDRLAGEDARANAFAGDWDAAMARFADGEDPLPRPDPAPDGDSVANGPEDFSSGLCNTRSKSPEPDDEWDDCEGDEDGLYAEDGSYEEDLEAKRQNRELRERIERERPAGAKLPEELGGDEWVRSRQSEAFDVGLDKWWTIVTEADLEQAYRAKGMWIDADAGLGKGPEENPAEPPIEFKSLDAPIGRSAPRTVSHVPTVTCSASSAGGRLRGLGYPRASGAAGGRSPLRACGPDHSPTARRSTETVSKRGRKVYAAPNGTAQGERDVPASRRAAPVREEAGT